MTSEDLILLNIKSSFKKGTFVTNTSSGLKYLILGSSLCPFRDSCADSAYPNVTKGIGRNPGPCPAIILHIMAVSGEDVLADMPMQCSKHFKPAEERDGHNKDRDRNVQENA